MGDRSDFRVYIGNVDDRVREKDLQRDFEKYGRLTRFDLKSGFAFCHFQYSEDAEDAIRAMNDRDYEGRRLIVEFGRGGGPRGAGGVHVDPPSGYRRGGGRDRDRGGGYGDRGGGYGGRDRGGGGYGGRDRYDDRRDGGRGRDRYDDRRDRGRDRSRSRDRRRDSRDRSRDKSRDRSRDRSRDKSRDRSRDRSRDKDEPKYQIEVDDLPSDTKRADLEDFGKKAGSSVTYAKVYDDRDRCWGVVEYSDKADYEAALKDLDDQELNGRRVRVTEAKGSSKDKDDRSPSPRRSASRSRGRSGSPKKEKDKKDDDDRDKEPAAGSEDKED